MKVAAAVLLGIASAYLDTKMETPSFGEVDETDDILNPANDFEAPEKPKKSKKSPKGKSAAVNVKEEEEAAAKEYKDVCCTKENFLEFANNKEANKLALKLFLFKLNEAAGVTLNVEGLVAKALELLDDDKDKAALGLAKLVDLKALAKDVKAHKAYDFADVNALAVKANAAVKAN